MAAFAKLFSPESLKDAAAYFARIDAEIRERSIVRAEAISAYMDTHPPVYGNTSTEPEAFATPPAVGERS